MSAATYLSIPQALVELRQSHELAPSYHQLWRAVVDGVVPSARVGKNIRLKREVLPTLAEHCALPKRAA